jgi:hypothetical protein
MMLARLLETLKKVDPAQGVKNDNLFLPDPG